MRGVEEVFAGGLSPYDRRLNDALVQALADDYLAWRATPDAQRIYAESEGLGPLLAFLLQDIEAQVQRIKALRGRHADFNKRYTRAVTDEERRQHILDYARDLGAGRWQLRGDRRALRRWFGADAVTDRFVRRHGAAERRLTFSLDRIGALAAQALEEAEDPGAAWTGLDLMRLVQPLFGYDGDNRVNVAAFRCLAVATAALPTDARAAAVEDTALADIHRAALDPRQPIWVQCEALRLLRNLSAASFRTVIEHRLRHPEEGDDLFVRRCAARLLGENLQQVADASALLAMAVQDPSPAVRQAAAGVLVQTEDATRAGLPQLARQDPVAPVRAAALCAGVTLLRRGPEPAEQFRTLLAEVMEEEKDPFVLRVAAHVAVEGTRLLLGQTPGDVGLSPSWPAWQRTVTDGLSRLHTGTESLAVRRWAAQARERIWCLAEPRARALSEQLRPALPAIRRGRSGRLPRRWFRKLDESLVGRVLSVHAQEDFGYHLERGWWGARLTRDHPFRFRLWRFLHELRHSDPAKRQAFSHVVGRVSYAPVRAPSAIMSELAETKVPGEPLFLGSEGGWRPYLPLPDDVLASLNQVLWTRPVRFYTSEGVTVLRPPTWPHRRLAAYLRLNWSFAHFARLRNWREGDPNHPASYLQALTALGFRIVFHPHADADGTPLPADPAVTRFFPALLLFAGAGTLGEHAQDLWKSFVNYFGSVYENSVPELFVFCALAIGGFALRHWFLNFTLWRARARLPLSVGGWGTRGKSGTERLKAALFNAMGHGLFSKTTGCEAMFLHAHPFGKTYELFLYRSYDKATIWEQRHVIRLAASLGADVFLWECMGLNPGYVGILQRQWMRDDLATLTNTYPDHEDIQGPAGVNIPEVMTRFIPRRSRLLTSEEQMRPVLGDAARDLATSFRGVGWLEAGLLPPDLLKRFPYEEHPYNIALVLSMADELGVDRDFALKEMADRVVADLGVLKTSPVAVLRTRRLEFSNGMSANERHGCLNNWVRLGFDCQDPEAEPGVWQVTVVNNRADRVARSRVFAGVLVNDLSADRHFLIGGNLSGLVGYIREAWDEHVPQLTLWPETGEGGPDGAVRVLEQAVRRFRLPCLEESVRARLRVMLRGLIEKLATPKDGLADELDVLWHDPDALRGRLVAAGVEASLVDAAVNHLTQDRKAQEEYRAFVARVRQAPERERAELDRAFRELLWKWFQAKLVVISDYHASGDQIISQICNETPPGFRNRIMGIQNIKGTGLDFVYRWEAWHACHRACTLLRSPDPPRAAAGLRELAAFQDYGVLSEGFVRETVNLVRASPFAQREEVQAQLDLVLANLDTKMETIRAKIAGGGAQNTGWLAKVCSALEAFLDAGDAVRRRKQSNRIYRDLVTERISYGRAILEVQALNGRQKGGWLLKRVKAWWALLTAHKAG
jgi:poly-gamma-glutamate synthase PgsB/CapB